MSNCYQTLGAAQDGFDRLFDLQMGRLVERLLTESFVVIAADPSPPSTGDRPHPAARLKAELRNGGFGFIQTGWRWMQVLSDNDHRSLLFVQMMTSEQATELTESLAGKTLEPSQAFSVLGVQVRGRTKWMGATKLAEEAASREGNDFLAETRSDGRCFKVDDMDLQPGSVRGCRERFVSMTATKSVAPLCGQLYQLHAYAGNPPPMLPRSGISRFSGDLPGVQSLIAYIPFVLPDHLE